MTIPAVTGGSTITSTWGNSVADAVNGLIDRYAWKLSRSVAQSIPNGVETAIAWDVENEDVGGFHSGSASTIVIPAGLGGLYCIGYTLRWSSSSGGSSRSARMTQGGSNFWGNDADNPATNSQPTLSGTSILRLADAATLDVRVFQNSGAALGVDANNSAPGLTEFYGFRLGD